MRHANLSRGLQSRPSAASTGPGARSVLHGVSSELLARIVERSTVRPYDKGEIVFASGDEEAGLYGIEQGSVSLSVDTSDGDRRVLTVLEPGSWFGLISAIDRKPKMHDAYASQPSLIRRLAPEAFEEITGTDAGYMRQFAVLLAAQTRLSVEGMLDASTLTPTARLAKRVLNLAELFGNDNGEISLEISQDNLAGLLGTSRQTIQPDPQRLGGARLDTATLQAIANRATGQPAARPVRQRRMTWNREAVRGCALLGSRQALRLRVLSTRLPHGGSSH